MHCVILDTKFIEIDRIWLLTAITLLITEWFERWQNGFCISYYKVAILCLLRRSYVLFISQQHMPPLSLSLATPFLHYAQNWLCWHCCINCNFILSSCILLIYVEPFLLLPLLRLHNINGSCYYYSCLGCRGGIYRLSRWVNLP